MSKIIITDSKGNPRQEININAFEFFSYALRGYEKDRYIEITKNHSNEVIESHKIDYFEGVEDCDCYLEQ